MAQVWVLELQWGQELAWQGASGPAHVSLSSSLGGFWFICVSCIPLGLTPGLSLVGISHGFGLVALEANTALGLGHP